MVATGAFFALAVPDMDASVNWYSNKLGLKVVMKDPKRDKTAVTVLEGGGLIVELIQQDDGVSLSTAAPGMKDGVFVHGIFKVGVIVNDFDKTLAMLKNRGRSRIQPLKAEGPAKHKGHIGVKLPRHAVQEPFR